MALLITYAEFTANTAFSGNIDENLITNHIQTAQDIELRNLLGQKLVEKLETDYSGGSISGYYATLRSTYVMPVLANYAAAYAMPFMGFKIAKGGVYQVDDGERTVAATSTDIKYLAENFRNTAQYYADRTLDYIIANSNQFPEFYTNVSGDVYPKNRPFRTSILL